MKVIYFKLGAIAYIALGVMHESAHLSKGKIDDPALANTLAEMKNTTLHIMGEHSLMKFYDGFSLTMGFLLFAFGLQALVMGKPSKQVVLVNIFVTLVILALTVAYFHIIASTMMFIAFVCFIIAFVRMKKA